MIRKSYAVKRLCKRKWSLKGPMVPYVRVGDINQGVQNKIRIMAIIFRRCLEFPAVCHPYFLFWIIGCCCCTLFSTFLGFTPQAAAFSDERKHIKACLPNTLEWLIPSVTFIPQDCGHLCQLEKLLFQALSSSCKILSELNPQASSYKVLAPNSVKHFKQVNDCIDFNPQVKLRLYFINQLHQHFICLSFN